MIDRRSRYYPAAEFDPAVDDEFAGVLPRAIGSATPALEHRVVRGDRLDRLALHYYNDDRLWWRIVDANPEFFYAGDMVLDTMLGKTILIPRERE